MTLIHASSLQPLLAELSGALLKRQQMLCTAESCTGGLIAAYCTSLAGSSQWFERGFVTYSNEAKHELLDIPLALIEQHGAVSEPVAHAMAQNALNHSRAHWSVSVTGIAGPSGGSAEKPVGLVWFGFARRSSIHSIATTELQIQTEKMHFPGDRHAVRHATVEHALNGLLARLTHS